MKASRQTSINICIYWQGRFFTSRTLDYHLLSRQDLLLQTLVSCYLLNRLRYDAAWGSLAILSKGLTAKHNMMNSAFEMQVKLLRSPVLPWEAEWKNMCLSEPEKNTAESSFQLIHYRPPAGESQSGQTKLFSNSQGHTRGYHVGLVKQTHKLSHTRSY